MLKLVGSDIDDTITHQHKLVPEVVTTFRQAQAQGIKIALLSARSAPSVDQIADQIGGEIYRISYNGAVVKNPFGQELQHQKLSAIVAQELVALIDHCGYRAELMIDHVGYFVGGDVSRRLSAPDPVFKSVSSAAAAVLLAGAWPTMIWIMGHDAIVQTYQQYHNHTQLYLSRHGLGLEQVEMSIVDQSVNKGQAISWLKDHLQLSSGEVLVIGDSENDLSMFAQADHSAAPANAHDSVKAQARYQVPAAEHGGAAFALSLFLA